MYLVKLIDKKLIMKLVKKKIIQISSKGDTSLTFSTSKNLNKHKFNIKDNKNSLLSKKSHKFNFSKKSNGYKKKIV